MSTHKQRDWAKTLRELIKFGIVGGSGFVVNIPVSYTHLTLPTKLL